ncbi:MAG: DUF4143 domain-containing protein [Chitinivibrionales bacterium]|nr:DUF4143 domain-containing protein [Chitinivibrionales bacterium]
MVFQHLNAWIDYGGWDAKIYFWRTRAGSEVDFIVYGKECFHAIEVKNSSRIRSDDLNGLQSFKSDYPECTPILLYRGKETVMQNSIYCTPVETYLRAIVPNCPLPKP